MSIITRGVLPRSPKPEDHDKVLDNNADVIEIWKGWFLRENPEKNLLEQGREPATNLTHIWHQLRDLNPGQIGGRQVLSPLYHPCSPSIVLECLYFHFIFVFQISIDKAIMDVSWRSVAIGKFSSLADTGLRKSFAIRKLKIARFESTDEGIHTIIETGKK